MEQYLIERLTENLVGICFKSKKDMAGKIGISYSTFLSVCSGQSKKQTAENVIGRILRYCIREHISLDNIFPSESTW